MKLNNLLVIIALLLVGGAGFYFLSGKLKSNPNPLATAAPTSSPQATVSPSPFPDTKSAVQAFLADKYKKPVAEVHVTVTKEVMGFASGSVLFGQGGPGEGGMWLAVLGNGWNVVWDGNGNVDCAKMRQDFGIPDTILKPNFCN